MPYTVQGDDGLAGAGAAAHSGGAVVAPFDQSGLGGVEEDLPAAEVAALQCLLQGVVGGGDDRRRPLRRRFEVVRVDRFGGGHRPGHLVEDVVVRRAVEQGEEHFTGELRRVLDEAEQLVLGGEGVDDGQQGFGDTEVRQLLVGPVGEQGPGWFGLRRRGRLGARRGWCGRGGEAAQDTVLDHLQVHVLDAAGDLADAVGQPVVDVLAVLDGDDQPVVVGEAQQQRPVLVVDARRPEPAVPLELLEFQPGGMRVAPELVLEVEERALDRAGELEDLLVRLVEQAQCDAGDVHRFGSPSLMVSLSCRRSVSRAIIAAGSHAPAVRTVQPAAENALSRSWAS